MLPLQPRRCSQLIWPSVLVEACIHVCPASAGIAEKKDVAASKVLAAMVLKFI